MVASQKQWGTTAPISWKESGDTHIHARAMMMEALDRDFPAETPEGCKKRKETIEQLTQIVEEWSFEVGMSSAGLDEETAREAKAKIFLFGSSVLGVLTPNSDIDCVCVVPKHITRDHFFQLLVSKFHDHPGISAINAVEEGHTPIIELKFNDIDVDVGFAQLNVATLRDVHSLQDDNLLVGLDEKSARGINGNRTNEQVLGSVPDKNVFREALRFVKSWAKARGLANNMLGFFGGITWAILVARVCQLYPNFNSALIVHRFFKVMEAWEWGWKKPVVLTAIQQTTNPQLLNLRIWDPRSFPHDKAHIMPVITPAFPAMNSTHNVSESTKRTIVREVKRGFHLMDKVLRHEASWEEVYSKCRFFGHHLHFIRILISAKNEATFTRWEGFIESKLRRLTSAIEGCHHNVHVRPWPEKFDVSKADPNWPFTKQMFFGLDFPAGVYQKSQSVDMRPAVEKFVEHIIHLSRADNYEKDMQDVFLFHCTREELPPEFRDVKFEEEVVKSSSPTNGARAAEEEENLGGVVNNQSTAQVAMPAKKQRKEIAVNISSY